MNGQSTRGFLVLSFAKSKGSFGPDSQKETPNRRGDKKKIKKNYIKKTALRPFFLYIIENIAFSFLIKFIYQEFLQPQLQMLQ